MIAPATLCEWLMARGLTPQQADLWGDFIADALELLFDSHTLLRTPDEWASFLNGCHRQQPTEPEITSGLGDRIRRLRHEAPIDSDRDRIHFSYESPTPGDHSQGIRKSRADFRFERKFEAGRAAAFVMEAKPLRTPADLTGRYLGAEGLGCFTDRDPPYSTDLAAGMVGYAFRDAPTWLGRLASALPTNTMATQIADVVLTGGRNAVASDHPRAGGLNPVTVIHAVLDFVEAQT